MLPLVRRRARGTIAKLLGPERSRGHRYHFALVLSGSVVKLWMRLRTCGLRTWRVWTPPQVQPRQPSIANYHQYITCRLHLIRRSLPYNQQFPYSKNDNIGDFKVSKRAFIRVMINQEARRTAQTLGDSPFLPTDTETQPPILSALDCRRRHATTTRRTIPPAGSP